MKNKSSKARPVKKNWRPVASQSSTSFLKSVSYALGKAEAALASLRTNLAQGKDMSVSSDKTDCSTLKKALEGDTNNGSMHLDGLKALRKRLKSFLT